MAAAETELDQDIYLARVATRALAQSHFAHSDSVKGDVRQVHTDKLIAWARVCTPSWRMPIFSLHSVAWAVRVHMLQ